MTDTFGPWHILTRYEDEDEWHPELVPTFNQPDPYYQKTAFPNWELVLEWFRLLENDLRSASIQIRIVPLPAGGANVPDLQFRESDPTRKT